MNKFLHTLTAYHLKFSFMKRNNPLRKELFNAIKNDQKPNIILTELINELITLTNNGEYALLESNRQVIMLDKIEDIYNIDDVKKRIFIVPRAGKTNIPTRMVNLKETKKTYNFGAEWTSTYPHNIFVYEINGEYYIVCHRQGGSGCKTILSSVFNKILKNKGIKVEMNWMPPVAEDSTSDFDIEKITLIYEENKSSDVADELNKKKKKIQIKELTLSLKTGKFENINNLLHKYKLKEISREETFKQIKGEVNDNQYNNASVVLKIGKTKKKVDWNDIEGLIDGFDITEKVSGLKNDDFINKLKECSDSFILSLINGE